MRQASANFAIEISCGARRSSGRISRRVLSDLMKSSFPREAGTQGKRQSAALDARFRGGDETALRLDRISPWLDGCVACSASQSCLSQSYPRVLAEPQSEDTSMQSDRAPQGRARSSGISRARSEQTGNMRQYSHGHFPAFV